MGGSPNLIAYVALIAWVPISLVLFTQLRPPLAAAATLLGAWLLLPVGLGFHVPLLPYFDREIIATFAALLGCLLLHPQALAKSRPGWGVEALVVVLVVGSFVTAQLNGDPLHYGKLDLPGLTVHDGLQLAIGCIITLGIPFFLGHALIRKSRDLRGLILLIAIAGLAYTPLVLWEVRMSPNLHRMLYGYHPSQFAQEIRAGGWRPVVFTPHGLALSLFLATTVIGAFGLARARIRTLRLPSLPLGGYLLVVLLLCKSLAAALYGLVAPPLILLAKPRVQLRLASLVAVIIFAYPALRETDLFPTQTFLEAARWVGRDRYLSLETRFDNEDKLLAKGRERPWFGWGSWGRNRVYDPRTGRDLSITDGYWIIQFGDLGAVGFLASFGLLLAPVWIATRNLRRIPDSQDRALLAVLALILVVHATDLIPNGFLSAFTVFSAGGLLGAAEGLPLEARAQARTAARNTSS